MPSNSIRIGIVGAGANTRDRHIPGFQAIEGVEVVAVCNRSRASSERVASQFGISTVHDCWQELVESPGVDAVCIGTWPYMHAEISIAALEAGKHVLTEARMARNVREAQAMLEASQRHPHLVAQVVPSPFTLDYDAVVIDLIKSGRLGELRQVDIAHTTPAYADASTPLTWRQDERLSGENMLTLGIYYEALQRWLGEEPVSVMALGAAYTKERVDPSTGTDHAVRIPDCVTVLARYAGSLLLHAHFSGIENGRGRNEFILNGSAGTLRIDVSTGRLFLAACNSRDEVELDVPPSVRRGWKVESDFVGSIRDGSPVHLTSFEQGLRYMRFTEAVWRSAESGGEGVTLR